MVCIDIVFENGDIIEINFANTQNGYYKHRLTSQFFDRVDKNKI